MALFVPSEDSSQAIYSVIIGLINISILKLIVSDEW